MLIDISKNCQAYKVTVRLRFGYGAIEKKHATDCNISGKERVLSI